MSGRARSETRGAVAGISELAAVEREAAAADALGEPELEALELSDAVVDLRCPGGRETGQDGSLRRQDGAARFPLDVPVVEAMVEIAG